MFKIKETDNYFLDKTLNYKVGIYCRISNEDTRETYNLESESIQNQKDLLTEYVLEQGWQLVDIYIDDGYSGLNFDRPNFKRMIEDIELGCINLVITKDLSRLGRDYISTGHYLEKYFPENNIRYIALNDGIDTIGDNINNDITPFRSVINDMYAKDISKKVRSAMDSKRRKGQFIGAFAPYGYKKDKTNKNKLIIDKEVAPIIKRIYMLYLQGMGFTKIAHVLNEEGILTPTEYKTKVKKNNYKGTAKTSLWGYATIRYILTNPTYMGYLSQNKCKKINYKSTKLKSLPRKNWIIVKDTHEGIIDIETFKDVQNLIDKKFDKRQVSKNKPGLFSGFVFCADCGAHMTYHTTSSGYTYLICSTYKRYTSKYCTRHSLKEEMLKKIVIKDITKLAERFVNRGNLINIAKNKANNLPTDEISIQIKNIEKRLDEIKGIIKSLYQDKFKGIITELDFIELINEFNKEKDILNKRYNSLNEKLNSITKQNKEKNKTYQLVENLIKFRELDVYTLEKLILRIDIYENKNVKITYNFKEPTNIS